MSTSSFPIPASSGPNMPGKASTATMPRRPYGLFVTVFLASFVILMLVMTREVDVYDEGITLAAAMRVGAGQIPHIDFYSIYGPLEFYLLAGLFRLFGPTILVERSLNTLFFALIATNIFAFTLEYSRKSIAFGATACAVAWMAISRFVGPIVPTLLFASLTMAAGTPVLWKQLSRSRLVALGVFTGLTFLLRYDVGVAVLLGLAICAVIGAYSQKRSFADCSRSVLHSSWPILLGAFVIVLPAVLGYRAHGSFHGFVHDLLDYPVHSYKRERNLPFPRPERHRLYELIVYLPAVVVVTAAVYLFGRNTGEDSRAKWRLGANFVSSTPSSAALLSFGLLTAVMWFKGLVRVGIDQMSSSLICAMVLMALLFAHRRSAQGLLRFWIVLLACLCVYDAGSSLLGWTLRLRASGKGVLQTGFSASAKAPATVRNWCDAPAPMTKGLCFATDADRMEAIQFIRAHAKPGQMLFSGAGRNDKSFANDNLIYFATQHLPATHWSHYDPGLQNSLPVQQQMVAELTRAQPYIVLDSEFDDREEPNDSAHSSGVFLLDDYIHRNYRLVVTFGLLSIYQPIATATP